MTACTYCGHDDAPTHRVQAYRFEGHGQVNLCAPNSECRCYWKFKNLVADEAEREEPPKRKLNGKPRPSYCSTLSRAAESARVDSILNAVLNRGPLLRGTPEWDERERARAVVGNHCLSFGAPMLETQSHVQDNLTKWTRAPRRKVSSDRTAKADIKRMEAARAFNRRYPLLLAVPLRGTPEWEQRESLRHRLGCKCLSFGALGK